MSFGRSIVVIVVLILTASSLYLGYHLWFKDESDVQVMVRIPHGATFDQILDSLQASGAIEARTPFRLLAIATGADSRIKPGTYKFHRGSPHAELLAALSEGRSTVREKVTFPEGITTRRVASIVADRLGIDSSAFIERAHDRTFLRSLGLQVDRVEGYLMPDTYYFFWGEQPERIIREMVGLFTRTFGDSLSTVAGSTGLGPYEIVILASIVEGEARVAEERPTIAGLYLNRLKRGMQLAADPTLQYIIPDGPRRLLYRDLKIDSPYNTYLFKGLPPTPINNPGRASIRAVMAPEHHDFLFMVAKGDGSGAHTFTRNAREHERAVAEYRARRDAQ